MSVVLSACLNVPARVAMIACLLSATAGLAQQPPPAEAPPAVAPLPASVINITTGAAQTISLTLDDVPLADVVRLFTRVSGANIIAATSNLTGQVTANLQDVEWKPALEAILERQGLLLIEKPPASRVYIIDTRRTTEDPRVSETLKLNYAKVDDVAKIVTSVLGKDGTVTPYPAGNVVIVSASAIRLAEVRKIVESVDLPRLQVYIETKIVQLSDGASKKLGIDWQGLNDYTLGVTPSATYGQLTTETDARTTAAHTRSVDDIVTRGVGAVLSADKFNIVLGLLRSTTGAKVISNPKIIVANEEKALITIAKEVPNVRVTVTQSTVADQPPVVSSELDGKEPWFKYGTIVEVQPRVNTASNITVKIKPELTSHKENDDVVVGTDASGKNKYPVIDKKSVETIFNLGDGCTAVIGGFIETTEDTKESHIPLLGDIPWLGHLLFGYTSRVVNQQEVLIFVTVGLVDAQAVSENAYLPKTTQLYLKPPEQQK